MSRCSRLSPLSGRLAAAAAAWSLAAATPATPQQACGTANFTHWCAHQDSAGVSGSAEPGDRFGAALAFGDFDDDGRDDLAIGAPGENDGAGVVHVFYSGGFSLALAGQQLLGQDNLGGADEGAEAGDELGFALAVGDFDGDGIDDLAIGSPGEDLPDLLDDCSLATCQDAGGIHVVLGDQGGLQVATARFFHADDLDDSGIGIRERDRLGAALAVGDFSEVPDGIDDLAVGAPFAPSLNPLADQHAGRVVVAFGCAGGFNNCLGGLVLTQQPDCEEVINQGGAALAAGAFEGDAGDELAVSHPRCALSGGSEVGGFVFYPQVVSFPGFHAIDQTRYASAGQNSGDHFAAALAAGDFDGDGFDELVAAAPGNDHGAGDPLDSGRVYVAYLDGQGFDLPFTTDIIGEDEWAGDAPGAGERFGSALAAGDVDGDGFDDLLAGAPGEGTADVGRVYLKRGSAAGLTTVDNALFTQTLLGGSNGDDDHLGSVIALGDVDGDGVLEIALGVPDKDLGGKADAGMVYLTRVFGPLLFADGFESGAATAWSTTAP